MTNTTRYTFAFDEHVYLVDRNPDSQRCHTIGVPYGDGETYVTLEEGGEWIRIYESYDDVTELAFHSAELITVRFHKVDLSDEAQLAIPKPDAPSVKQTLDLVGIRNSVVQSLMNRIRADEDRMAERAQFDRDHQKPGEGPSESAVNEYKAGLEERTRVEGLIRGAIIRPNALFMWTSESGRIYLSAFPRNMKPEDDEEFTMSITATHMQPDYDSIVRKQSWIRNMCRVFNITLIEQ